MVGLCLVCLHPNNADYQLIEVPFLEKEMVDLFLYRKEMLVKTTSVKATSANVPSAKATSAKGLLLDLNNL